MKGCNVLKVLVHNVYIKTIANGSKNHKKSIANVLKVNLSGSSQNEDQHPGKTQQHAHPFDPANFKVEKQHANGKGEYRRQGIEDPSNRTVYFGLGNTKEIGRKKGAQKS